MAKSELGTKRVCPDTGRKFYDLNKTPVVSPYTGKIVPIVAAPVSRSRPEAAEDEDVEIDESLDDAAFIEEEEEGNDDVTDIIGESIEKEEES